MPLASAARGPLRGEQQSRAARPRPRQEYACNNPMARDQLSTLLDMSGQLLGDNNYKARAAGFRAVSPCVAGGSSISAPARRAACWFAGARNSLGHAHASLARAPAPSMRSPHPLPPRPPRVPRPQVALRALQVWEAVVQNEGDGAKPFVNNLLPFVVRPAMPRSGAPRMRRRHCSGRRALATRARARARLDPTRPAPAPAPARMPAAGRAPG